MKRPLRNGMAFVALVMLVAVTGCPATSPQASVPGPQAKPKKTVTEEAVSTADNLKLAVDQFEASRKDTSKAITETTKTTNTALQVKKPQLEGIAKDWEDRWTKVKEQAQTLEANLKAVGERSLKYFEQLESLANSISDPGLRGPEQEKNRALKQRWTQVYTAACKDVEKLRPVVVKGDDFHKILLGAALRQSLEKDMKAIEDIANQAEIVLRSLEPLTEEGRKLTVKN